MLDPVFTQWGSQDSCVLRAKSCLTVALMESLILFIRPR